MPSDIIVLKEHSSDNTATRFSRWRINAVVTREQTFVFVSASAESGEFFLVNSGGRFSEFFLDVLSASVENVAGNYSQLIDGAISELESFMKCIDKEDSIPLERAKGLKGRFHNTSNMDMPDLAEVDLGYRAMQSMCSYAPIAQILEEANAVAEEYVECEEESDTDTIANDSVGV